MRRPTLALLLVAPLWLAGCDMLGMESASVVAARREADGKAVGAGCRHAARSVEQCYEQNKRAEKAAIFAGWKEMNDYMRENKIEPVPTPAESVTEVAAADVAEAGAKKPGKPDSKPDTKPVAKKH